MALVVKDRVKETTTTTGTGSISLGGAVTKFKTFSSALSDGDTTYYAIEQQGDDNEFEVGIGTYASSGNTLARTTILSSSNSNNAVDFSAGTKNIFITYPADKAVYEDASGNVSIPGNVELISTDTSSIAGPEFCLYRNSATPADGDYLGQVKFQGESDTGVTRLYAKITGKTSDVTNGTEDGLIETAVKKDGANVIVSRQTGTALKLINNTGLEVAGQIDAEGGIDVTGNATFTDNGKAIFGAGSDLQIYHDGAASYIDDVGTGNLFVRGNNLALKNADGSKSYFFGTNGGAANIYYDGASKLATTSTGISVTGNATFADDGKAIFGAGSDLQIFHDGTDTQIDNNTGTLIVRSSAAGTIEFRDQGSQVLAQFNDNSDVKLYHNNNEKLATTSTGVDITGALTVSGTVDGVDIAAFKNAYDSHTHTFGNITSSSLSSSNDLDSYTTRALAHWGSSNPSNSPSTYGAMLVIPDGSQSQQLVQTYGGATNKVSLYGRRRTGGTWDTSWTQYFSDHYHPNADTLTTARTINGVSFDGSANITIADSTKLPLSGGTLTGGLTAQTLTISSNSVGSTSDIALTANAAINAENSLSFGMTNASSSYYRWMFGNNSKTGGTGGGTEKMRLDKDGNLTLSGTVDGVDIAARDAVLTSTTTTANAALPKSGGTMTGELQVNARLDVGTGSGNDTEIRIYKADNNVSDHLQFYNGTTRIGEIGGEDNSWLRINQETNVPIYTPRYIRSDGGFFVAGTTKGINGSGNFVGGTISGATDANVSNWNTAYTTANAALPKSGGEMTGALTIDTDNVEGGALRIEANQTNTNNDFYFAQEIVSTLSGSQTATSNREQGGIYLDLNSSNTGGDTSNEHRVYGAYLDVDSSGDADAVYGVWANATATPTTGTTSNVIGGYFYGEDNGGAGEVTTVIGVQGLAVSDNSNSDTNSLQAGFFKAYNTADTGNIGSATAVYGEIEIPSGSGDHYGTSYVFRAEYDNNDTTAQTNTTYLYYGNYAGTLPTTAYGVYIGDDVKNYLGGSLGLGVTSPSQKLDVNGNIRVTGGFVEFSGSTSTPSAAAAIHRPADNTLAFSTLNTERMRLTSGGDLLIGRTTSSLGGGSGSNLQIGSGTGGAGMTIHSGTASLGDIQFADGTTGADSYRGLIRYNHSTNDMQFWSNGAEDMRLTSGGDLHVDGNVIAYSTTISDERLKEDIKPIEGALDKVGQLNGYTFTYKADGKQSAGVIAQEVEKVLPSAIQESTLPLKTDDDLEYKTVQYDQLHGLLIEAIKELKAEIEELKNGPSS